MTNLFIAKLLQTLFPFNMSQTFSSFFQIRPFHQVRGYFELVVPRSFIASFVDTSSSFFRIER